MLQLNVLREKADEICKALEKRNLEARPLIDQVLNLDEKRRSLQTQLDNTLAESNRLSKEIGILFKNKQIEEANALKEKTSSLKEEAKILGEDLSTTAVELKEALYQIPNIPHDLVPAGGNEEDNEEVFREGDIPELGANARPHWELAQEYDIIDF